MTSRRGEVWKRRRAKWESYDGDLWTTMAEPQIWLNISSPEPDEMEINSESESTPTSKVNTFEQLTTGTKFRLIRAVVSPISAKVNQKGSVAIKVKNKEVEELLNTNSLGETPVLITKDPYKNLIRGEIKHDTIAKTPEKEIIEELSEINCVKVRKLERPKRDQNRKIVKNEQNQTIFEFSGVAVVTLELESLPTTQVDFFCSKINIQQHEPDPTLCRKCYKYGHTKKYCDSPTSLCGRCCKVLHTAVGGRCENDPECIHCKVDKIKCDHTVFDRECPTWVREKEILYIKEIQKIPYPAARAILDQRMKESSIKSKEREPTLDALIEVSNQRWEERMTNSEAKWKEQLAQNNAEWERKLQEKDTEITKLRVSIDENNHLLKTLMGQIQQDRLANQVASPSIQPGIYSTPVRGYMNTINIKTPGKTSTPEHIEDSDKQRGPETKKQKQEEGRNSKPPDKEDKW